MLTQKAHKYFPDAFARKNAHFSYTNSDRFFSPYLARLRAAVEVMTVPNLNRQDLFKLNVQMCLPDVMIKSESGSAISFHPVGNWRHIDMIVDGSLAHRLTITGPDAEDDVIEGFIDWCLENCEGRQDDCIALIEGAMLKIQSAGIHAWVNDVVERIKSGNPAAPQPGQR